MQLIGIFEKQLNANKKERLIACADVDENMYGSV